MFSSKIKCRAFTYITAVKFYSGVKRILLLCSNDDIDMGQPNRTVCYNVIYYLTLYNSADDDNTFYSYLYQHTFSRNRALQLCIEFKLNFELL